MGAADASGAASPGVSVTRRVRGVVAWLVLASAFGVTWAIARLLRHRRDTRPATGRLLVTGTFFNRGWFLSHVEPLSACGLREVIVVTDVVQPAPERVTVLAPPRWVVKCVGRAAAKLWFMWRVGGRVRPDLYVGYHLFPGALSALIAARLNGRPAAYQMTGGPVEVMGGGNENENALMSSLNGPSAFLERLSLAVLAEFDLIVVRGQKARRFLADRGITQSVRIITGSVREGNGAKPGRPIDLIFVGRLARIKQPERFVEIVSKLAARRPEVRAVMVGGGPEEDALRTIIRARGIERNVELLGQRTDIHDLLVQSKLFVLTSRSEGLSIAMVEAMSCGVPPVVADVGELADVVANGVNGWLVPGDDVDAFATRIDELLSDGSRWEAFSRASREAAVALSGLPAVTRRWRECLSPMCATDANNAAQ